MVITIYAAKNRVTLVSVFHLWHFHPSALTFTERGWTICLTSRKMDFKTIATRDIFIPPAVEPAQPPIIIRDKNHSLGKHRPCIVVDYVITGCRGKSGYGEE